LLETPIDNENLDYFLEAYDESTDVILWADDLRLRVAAFMGD
jgi:hypothetical protein